MNYGSGKSQSDPSLIKTIDELWLDFVEEILPAGIPEIQRREMKRAFFGGFTSALFALTVGLPKLPFEQADAAIQGFHNQVSDFFKAVRENRA